MRPPRRGGVYYKYRLTSSMRMRRHLLRSLLGKGETPAAFGYDIRAGFHPRPDAADLNNVTTQRAMGPPVNSARWGRAAGSSRTPTPIGLREMYAGAETVESAKPSRPGGVPPPPGRHGFKQRHDAATDDPPSQWGVFVRIGQIINVCPRRFRVASLCRFGI